MGHLRQIRSRALAEPMSHYTDAVLAGKTLYVSGIVATDASGAIVGEGDVAEQAWQIFRNLRAVLNEAGGGPEDVVKVTVFMREVSDRPRINPIRQEFFGSHRPASTLVE